MRRFLLGVPWHTITLLLAILFELAFVAANIVGLFWPTAKYLRWLLLNQIARTRLRLGLLQRAQSLSAELLGTAGGYKDDWNYGNAIHQANILLGRISLRRGNTDAAKRYLLSAGRTCGSPQLNSFGPNMTLANEMLATGQTSTVLEYLELCSVFWKSDFGKLDKWTTDIIGGQRPRFGPNMHY